MLELTPTPADLAVIDHEYRAQVEAFGRAVAANDPAAAAAVISHFTDATLPDALALALAAIRRALAAEAFKAWAHSYLDAQGVPHHPPGAHGAEGCRIGDRLDWLMARLRGAEASAKAERNRAEVWEGELDRIAQLCGLAGVGGAGMSARDMVKDLHAELGRQIARADAAEAEVARLNQWLDDARLER